MNHFSVRMVFHRTLSLILAGAMALCLFSMTGCDDTGYDDSDGGSISARHYGKDSGSDAAGYNSDKQRRYFGNQLDTKNSRYFYDQLVEQYVEKEKDAGKFTMYLANPIVFDIEFSQVPQGTIQLGDYKEYCENTDQIGRDFFPAFMAFQWDYPEVFWVYWYSYNPDFESKWSDDNKTLHCRYDNIQLTTTSLYSGAYNDRSKAKSSIEKAVDTIKSQAEDNSRYALVKAAHDYLARNAEYDTESIYAGNDAMVISGSPASFFVSSRKLICQGYSKTFQVICGELDIPCLYIHGTAYDYNLTGGAHAWNYVQMDDGKWYGVDVTWDDPGTKIENSYLLVGSKTKCTFFPFKDDHHPDGYHIDSGTGIVYDFEYPVLSKNKYN